MTPLMRRLSGKERELGRLMNTLGEETEIS
jgi:hypothetical protein